MTGPSLQRPVPTSIEALVLAYRDSTVIIDLEVLLRSAVRFVELHISCTSLPAARLYSRKDVHRPERLVQHQVRETSRHTS